jgi:hypothetical protein
MWRRAGDKIKEDRPHPNTDPDVDSASLRACGRLEPSPMIEDSAGFEIVCVILFGITLIVVAGYYFVRVALGYLTGKRPAALQERSAGAGQARTMARLSFVVGPLFTALPCAFILLMAPTDRGFRWPDVARALLTTLGVGAVAGTISGGAFWASSALLGRVRKTLKKRGHGPAWDPDFDGVA